MGIWGFLCSCSQVGWSIFKGDRGLCVFVSLGFYGVFCVCVCVFKQKLVWFEIFKSFEIDIVFRNFVVFEYF